MKSAHSLSRLSDRIELAIKEIDRLRSENKALSAEIERARQKAERRASGTTVVFEDSEKVLRERLDACIAVIDAHLAQSERS